MTDYPTYAPRRATMDQITQWSTFTGMHPKMQERITGLLEASGGKVGLGQGLRPAAQQLQLFLSRHVPDSNGRYRYDGRRWSRLPGKAPAAPPGSSMHEIGLAADLVGDLDWVGRNAANFDLQTFANVNNEPWHVQPAELPRSRSSYERGPAWGRPPWKSSNASTSSGASSSSTSSTSSSSSSSSSGGDGAGGATTPVNLTPALRARPGESGPAVDVMHEALIARSLLADTPSSRSGTYDADDRVVVEGFQADAGLVVDGIVGPQTWGPLLRVVEPGADGPHVRVLQVTMIRRGLLRDTQDNLDGVYGTATQRVVEQFQGVAGLHVDGAVGPVTWTALIGEQRKLNVATRGGAADDGDDFDYDDIDVLAILEGRPCE